MLTVAELLTTERGVIVSRRGVETTVKFVLEVAVLEPTVTDMGPVVAVFGTVAVRELGVADITVAGAPLKLTALDAAVVLKFCPWI